MSFSSSHKSHHTVRFVLRTTIVAVVSLALAGGIAESAQAAMPTGPTTTGLTGARTSATRLSFPVSDQVNASVDVATGNLLVTTSGLKLPGVNSQVPIGASFNSLSTISGNTSTPAANGWIYGLAGAGTLSTVSGGLVLTTADGATWKFASVGGSQTAFTTPTGLNDSLVASLNSGGYVSQYTLTDLAARTVTTFDVNGNPLTTADKNSNTVTINYTAGIPSTVVSTVGPASARTATFNYATGTSTLTVTQNFGQTPSRNIQFVKDASSNLIKYVDATGKSTGFGYTSGKLTSITNPLGFVTSFTYGSTGLVTQVDQNNTTSGSTGTSTTRLSYVSSTQTQVAGPNTSTSSPVASVANTTYTIGAGLLVTDVKDPLNRDESASYNAANSGVTVSAAGTGTDKGTSTNAYGANSAQSLTSAQSPGGSTSTATYTNFLAATKFLPTTTTDDAGNSTAYSYNGTGNQLSNTTTTSSGPATAASAVLGYNSNLDGTVVTATAPGNSGNPTTYGYLNHQLAKITPPTGSSLGVKNITYDTYGRLLTETDGKTTPVTVTYGYDNDDRLLSTTFSDSTHSTVNTYDAAGHPLTSVDGNGTTTNTYDLLGRLMSTVNTAGGGTEQYGYDKASNLITTTDTRGVTTNAYDVSGIATSMTYAGTSGNHVTLFLTDTRGRRTDEWLQSNADHSVWAAHEHTVYDPSGRITESIGQTGTGNSSYTPVMDVTYCYNSASAAPTCATGTGTDHARLQWSKDMISGQVTTYTYDLSGHLLTATQSGGTANNTYTYTYDANGNRLTAVVTGTTPSSQTLTYNSGNQISTAGYTYDGAGNLLTTPTAKYTYNGAEQMTSALVGGVTTTYTYAGTSETKVLSESGSQGTYKITYGRSDQYGNAVIEQYQVGSVTAFVENDPGTGAPVMLRTSNGIQCLYVDDGIGNPVALLTDAAYAAYVLTYDPYGTAVVAKGGTGNGYTQNPFTFKGGIQDRASGLVKFGLRWYDPTTGRWTQQDTLDAPLDARNANRYAYAGDDPINNLDLSGLYNLTRTAVIGLAGGVGGLISGCAAGAVAGAAALGAGAIPGCVGGLVGGFLIGFVAGAAADATAQLLGY